MFNVKLDKSPLFNVECRNSLLKFYSKLKHPKLFLSGLVKELIQSKKKINMYLFGI